MNPNTLVELREVTVWRDGVTILEDVSWQVRRGEHWVVLGANGSGKTTLLQIVAGYQWPSQGRVAVLGRVFGAVDLRELRTTLGWVSSALAERIPGQQTALAAVVSGRTAALGLWDRPAPDQWEEAAKLLQRLGCAEVQERRWTVLSQGERQRVLIARALMTNPRLLVLDEPCAGLDLAAREELLEAVDTLTRTPSGPGVILVTHHLEEVVNGLTHALVLQAGRVVAQGPKERVLTAATLSAALRIEMEVEQRNGRYWVRVNGESRHRPGEAG